MVAYGVHGDGREHLGFLPLRLQGGGEGQRVDDGGQHSHLVTFHAVEALGCALHPAEDVAPADDDGHLHTCLHHGLYLGRVFIQAYGIDAVMLGTHQ